MLNEGLDRDSMVTKVMGILCGLAAIAGLVLSFLFGWLNLVIALGNGLLAFICFVAHDREREIILGAVGAVLAAEVIGLITGVHTTTLIVNTLVSVVCYAAIFLYIFGNNVTRNRAMWCGAVLTVDAIIKMARLASLLELVERSGIYSEVEIFVTKAAVYASAVAIVPAFVLTVLLFTGNLNYGN